MQLENGDLLLLKTILLNVLKHIYIHSSQNSATTGLDWKLYFSQAQYFGKIWDTHCCWGCTGAAIQFEKPEKAVEFLEQGLAVTYRQLLQLKDESALLTLLTQKLANQLKQISLYLQKIEGTHPLKHIRITIFLLWRERTWLKKSADLMDFQRFSLPSSHHDLSYAAKEGLIILINNTALRSDALIILSPHTPVETVALSDVTLALANKKLETLHLVLYICLIKSKSDHDPPWWKILKL